METCNGNTSGSQAQDSFQEEKSFEKTMMKTCFELMTVPADFVEDYEHEFTKWSYFGYDGGKANWIVNVNVYVKPNSVHIAFGAGWGDFAKFHHIAPGHRVKFELVSKSNFNVKKVA